MSHERLTLRAAPDARDMTVRSLTLRASTLDEAARSIEVVVATEARTAVMDMNSWSVIDEELRMDGCELPQQVPLLADHMRYSIEAVRGSIRGFRIEGGNLIGRAFFAKDEDSERAWQKVKDGHLTDVSAGYRVSEFQDIAAGQTSDVGGRSYTAGQRTLRVSRKWTPREGSLVPIGADPNSKFREDPIPSTNRGPSAPKDLPMNFEQWLSARGIALASLTDAQRAALKADFDALQARAVAPAAVAPVAPVAPANPEPTRAAPASDESVRAEGMRLERERATAVRAAGEGLPADLVNRAVNEGWDINRANAEFLAHSRAARGNPATVELVADKGDKMLRGIETSLCLRAGLRITDQARLDEANGLRGVGIQDIARLCIQNSGERAPTGADELFKRAISTASFPVALGNTLNRILLGSYEESPSTILEWASVMEVKDFREHKAISMGKFAAPVKVGKGGMLEHGTLSEEAEGYQADTYGRLFSFTRKDFINDDLGLFQRVPMELGASMKRNIDDIGYALLVSAAGVGPTMDSTSPGDAAAKALFATDRSDGANYIAGATVLSSNGLRDLKILLRKIKQGGTTLNLLPMVLLVPAELEQAALELVKASTLYGSSTSDAGKPNVNIHQGSLKVVVEPRLSAATNGTTAWYLVCSPVQAKSLAVCFLRGQQAPTVERSDPANVLGVGWRAYHDVGVDAIDWRGIARSKGA